MFTEIENRCQALVKNFHEISQERKFLLSDISKHLQKKLDANEPIQIVYICTHNSRRSHLGQVWGAVSASFFKIPNVETFSGGTEATAIHPHALEAIESQGFNLVKTDDTPNPCYHVYYDSETYSTCFSKVFSHKSIPQKSFIAIMTCSDAEENCPLISGCDLRVGLTYHDPKSFDGTPQQLEKYLERSNHIAMENLYLFSLLKSN